MAKKYGKRIAQSQYELQLTHEITSLRREKKTYREIADALQVSVGTVCLYLNRAYSDLAEEMKGFVNELRMQEYEHLMELRDQLNKTMPTDDRTVHAYIRISEQISKLFGLYQSPEIHLTQGTQINVMIKAVDYRSGVKSLKPIEIETDAADDTGIIQ